MRKRFPGEMTVLGGFEMTSQTMRVSDPCYDRDVWCCGTFGKCKTGTWEAGVLKTDMGDWGVRCAVLAVRHKETGPDYSVIRQRKVYQMKDGWLEQPIDVGVDSGQAGFYDEAFYQDNSIFKGMPEPEHDYGDLWYNHACDITLSEVGRRHALWRRLLLRLRRWQLCLLHAQGFGWRDRLRIRHFH